MNTKLGPLIDGSVFKAGAPAHPFTPTGLLTCLSFVLQADILKKRKKTVDTSDRSEI